MNTVLSRLFFGLLIMVNTVMATEVTVMHNINGHSINSGELINFKAIAFTDGMIKKIGSSDELMTLFPDAQMIDGQNQFVLPGLHDSLSNVMQSALASSQVDLSQAQSIEAVQKKVQEFATKHPDKPWILGFGWDHARWENPVLPTHQDLDDLQINRPIWLKSRNNKIGLANTKAMEITKAAKYKNNPSGGEIIFKKDQSHSGIYIDHALNIIAPHIPDIPPDEKYKNLRDSLEKMASLGITNVYDSGINYRTMVIYKALANNGDLPIRVNVSIASSEKKLPIILRNEAYHQEGQFLHIHGLKYYIDGELDTHSAALYKPYTDRMHSKGRIKQSLAFLKQNIYENSANTWQAAIHAVGDMANNIAISVITSELANGPEIRHRIEKATVIEDKDLLRLNDKAVIFTILPHAAVESFQHNMQKLGRKRSKSIHPWQNFIKNGATVVAGSGFPQYPANPFLGIQAAVTRKNNNSTLFYSKKFNLNLKQALAAYTINAAYANRQEMTLGSLEAGKWADFILVNKNIMTSAPEEISDVTVLQTWVAGQKIYEK